MGRDLIGPAMLSVAPSIEDLHAKAVIEDRCEGELAARVRMSWAKAIFAVRKQI